MHREHRAVHRLHQRQQRFAELTRLREAHPQLTLELLTGSRPVDLERGEADLAIRSGPIGDALIARRLVESGFSLYAAPAYLARHPAPIELDDLSGHDVIGFDPVLADVPPAQWLAARTQHATIVLRSRELADIQAATLAGAGLAMLPCLAADAQDGLVRLTPQVLARRTLWLVYPRESRLSQPVQAVIHFVLDVLRDHAARIEGTPA